MQIETAKILVYVSMRVLGTYVVDDGAAGWCRLAWDGEPEPVELSGLGRGGLVGFLTAMQVIG